MCNGLFHIFKQNFTAVLFLSVFGNVYQNDHMDTGSFIGSRSRVNIAYFIPPKNIDSDNVQFHIIRQQVVA